MNEGSRRCTRVRWESPYSAVDFRSNPEMSNPEMSNPEMSNKKTLIFFVIYFTFSTAQT